MQFNQYDSNRFIYMMQLNMLSVFHFVFIYVYICVRTMNQTICLSCMLKIGIFNEMEYVRPFKPFKFDVLFKTLPIEIFDTFFPKFIQNFRISDNDKIDSYIDCIHKASQFIHLGHLITNIWYKIRFVFTIFMVICVEFCKQYGFLK